MANSLSSTAVINPTPTKVNNKDPNGNSNLSNTSSNMSGSSASVPATASSAGVSYPTSERGVSNTAQNAAGINASLTQGGGLSSVPPNAVVVDTTAEDETPAVAMHNVTSNTANLTREYLDNYNQDREQKIRDMYAGNLAAQKAQQQTAYDANMASLRNAYEQNVNSMRNAYEQNMSDAEAYREGITPRYQQGMNALSAEYERQRRNNNMQAAVNGLNTGAGSQMALAQSMGYQANQGNLSRSEQEALNEADRAIGDLSRDYNNRNSALEMQYNNNMTALRTNYENRIAEAAANNDYQLAAALLDEYGAQYDRTMQQAAQLAEFGDFSMYANIYGVDAAQQMEKMWSYQNPDLAYNLGRITADDYFNMTGMYPSNYMGAGGVGYGVRRNADGTITYAGKTYGKNSGKAAEQMDDYDYNYDLIYQTAQSAAQGKNNRLRYRYSYGGSGRDRAYRGPAGYYNTAGNFVVPETGMSYGSASGSDKWDKTARDENAKAFAERNL